MPAAVEAAEAAVELDPAVVRAIAAAMAAAWPREIVALLGGPAGGSGLVTTIVPVPNVADDDDAFAVRAADFAAGEHRLRAAGATWLGFVHSHPRSAAAPSRADHAALWRDCLQLIAAGDGRTRFDLRAFRWTASTCAALPLRTAGPSVPEGP